MMTLPLTTGPRMSDPQFLMLISAIVLAGLFAGTDTNEDIASVFALAAFIGLLVGGLLWGLT